MRLRVYLYNFYLQNSILVANEWAMPTRVDLVMVIPVNMIIVLVNFRGSDFNDTITTILMLREGLVEQAP